MDNHWKLVDYKKDGSTTLQNTSTYEVMEVDKNGKIIKRYFPKSKKISKP